MLLLQKLYRLFLFCRFTKIQRLRQGTKPKNQLTDFPHHVNMRRPVIIRVFDNLQTVELMNLEHGPINLNALVISTSIGSVKAQSLRNLMRQLLGICHGLVID